MVFSEIAAATLIAVCGLKKSYRIVLRGERLIRRRIGKPLPIVEGYDSFPRFFVRRVFRAGLGIAMRWEGRAKTAAQRAAEARMSARRAGKLVVSRAEDMRVVAKDRAKLVASRAEDMRSVAKDRASAVRDRMSREYAKRTAARSEASARGRDGGRGGRDGGRMASSSSSPPSSASTRSIVPPSGEQDRTMKMVHTRFR